MTGGTARTWSSGAVVGQDLASIVSSGSLWLRPGRAPADGARRGSAPDGGECCVEVLRWMGRRVGGEASCCCGGEEGEPWQVCHGDWGGHTSVQRSALVVASQDLWDVSSCVPRRGPPDATRGGDAGARGRRVLQPARVEGAGGATSWDKTDTFVEDANLTIDLLGGVARNSVPDVPECYVAIDVLLPEWYGGPRAGGGGRSRMGSLKLRLDDRPGQWVDLSDGLRVRESRDGLLDNQRLLRMRFPLDERADGRTSSRRRASESVTLIILL